TKPTDQIERRFRSKREAEDWLDGMKHGAKSGVYIDPRKAERRVEEVASAWRETWTDLEPKTRAGYEAILKKHVDPCFGKAQIGAVTPDAIQRYINELSKTRAPNTVRRIFSVLRSVMRVAVERRYIAVSPCDAVKLPKKGAGRSGSRPARMLFLSPPEVRQ